MKLKIIAENNKGVRIFSCRICSKTSHTDDLKDNSYLCKKCNNGVFNYRDNQTTVEKDFNLRRLDINSGLRFIFKNCLVISIFIMMLCSVLLLLWKKIS